MQDYFQAIIDADFAVPSDRTAIELLDELCAGLVDKDPTTRDDVVYPVFATWVETGHFDSSAEQVGDRICELFNADQIQARTFATLILAELINRDTTSAIVSAATAHRWYLSFAQWWGAETDVRGYDDTLGWLHAIAHGADTLGAFAMSPHLTAQGLLELLDLAVTRLVVETPQVWSALEDDRLALACNRILSRPELSAADSTQWLEKLAEALTAGSKVVPPAAWWQNALHTLKSLHVQLDHAVVDHDGAEISVPHASLVKEHIAKCLRIAWLPLADS